METSGKPVDGASSAEPDDTRRRDGSKDDGFGSVSAGSGDRDGLVGDDEAAVAERDRPSSPSNGPETCSH